MGSYSWGCSGGLSACGRTLKPLWPGLLKSFAWVGGPAMLGVVATGVPLAWSYIGTWQGLMGTDYGAMVLIKVALLVAALGFAA